jgi:hypothetical protein
MVILLNKISGVIMAVLCFCVLLPASASAQTNGFHPINGTTYYVQYPTNATLAQRFTASNGVYTCWVYGDDSPTAQTANTLPRTEMRWSTWTNQNLANQISFDEQFGADTQNTCIHQIKSDGRGPGLGGGEALYLQVNQPGTLRNSVGPNFASGVSNTWFHINSIYDPATGLAVLYYNGLIVASNANYGPYPAGGWYFKTGVYDNGMPTNAEAWVQISNVVFWVQDAPPQTFSVAAIPSVEMVLAGASTNFTVGMSTNKGFSGTVVLGVSGLPAGATASFSPATLKTNGTTTLTIQTTTNTFGGNYVLTIGGTNGTVVFTTNVTLNLIGVNGNPGNLLWSGASGADTNWSTLLNWTNLTAGGYGPPGSGNNVVFTNAAAVGTAGMANNVVDGSCMVASVQYANNAAATSPNYQVTLISSGQTLFVTNGLSAGTGADSGAGQVVNAVITGLNGTLVLSNGVVAVAQGSGSDGAHQAVMDLSGLGTLVVTNVSKMDVGVLGLPPQNGNGGQRSSGVLYLARTNIISVTSTGVTNGILVGWNDSQGNGNSSGVPNAADKVSALYLGQASSIFTDAIYVGTDKTLGSLLAFNPNGLNNPSAYIRGADSDDGTPVSWWGIGDSSMKNGSNQSASGTNDFSGGMVDALVNNMNIGVTQTGSSGGNTGNGTGLLTFDAGTIEVNNLTNGWSEGSGTSSGSDVGTGTVNVNGVALLIIDTTLALAQDTGGGTGVSSGTLNINGGTVQAANIVGGPGISTINLNSGTLDLQADNPTPGQITNVTTLNIGAGGQVDAAQLINAARIASPNAINIATNGMLAGNTAITAPGLVVDGTIEPGGADGVGAITNSGGITLGAGGTLVVGVQNVTGGPVAGWDYLQANGGLTIQATGADPFMVQVQSFSPNGAGVVADYNNNTNYNWNIAGAVGGIAGFAANKFTVNDPLFVNDLAGGYFYVRTNAGSLLLAFTNNHPPAAGTVTLYRTGNTMAVPVAMLATNWSDPDSDPVAWAGVTGSTNGAALGSDGSFVYYTNANNVADEILYTVKDVRTNPPAVYRAGDTQRTATGTIILLPPPVIGGVGLNGGGVIIRGTGGKPGGTYYVLAATNLALPLSGWTVIATNSYDDAGNINFTNPPNPSLPETYYRLRVQ